MEVVPPIHGFLFNFEHRPITMSKLAEKRIALAKQVLETVDAGKWEALEEVLRGAVSFTPAQVAEFEEQLARIEAGTERTSHWPEVKKRVMKRPVR